MPPPPERTPPPDADTPPTSVRPASVRPRAPSPPSVPHPRPGPTSPRPAPAPTAPGIAPAPATWIHDFRVIRVLGRGGMAEVHLAERKDGRKAAVKLLLPQYAQDPEIVRRFMLEMKATASLQHPNVVQILDFGDAGGQYFLATEYMDAGSLRDLQVGSGGRLTIPAVEAIAAMMLQALSAAHARQLIHRDLKPANILLDSHGTAKLGDFGVARALDVPGPTRTGLIMGTPAYMSPEQASGEALDGRSDLFALGIVLYELLAGFNPFTGSNESASLMKVMAAEPPLLFETNASIPAPLESFVHRLLARERAQRFASADAALSELGRHAPQAVTQPRDVVREALLDPSNAYARWAQPQGQRHLTYAQSLLQLGPARRPQAILELFRAHILAPQTTSAAQLLRELFNGRDPFAAPQNPKIAELEAELQRQPQSHALLMQLAALYKLELAPLKAIGYYRRALRLRPDDGYAIGQLRALMGDEADSLLSSAHLTLQTQPPRSPPGASTPRPRTSTAVRTAAVPIPAATPPIGYQAKTKNPLAGKLVWLASAIAVIVLIGGAFRAAGRFIDASQTSTNQATEHLTEAMKPSDAPSTQEAIDSLVQARREKGEHLFDEGMRLLADGQTDQAEDAFKTFRTEYPKHPKVPEATFQLAKIYTKFDQSSAADQELEPYIKDHPADPHIAEARLMLGKAKRGLGDQDAALKEFDGIVQDHPSSPIVTDALFEAGVTYAAKGDKVTAQKRFEAVLGRTGPADELYRKASAGLDQLKSAP